jgi:hypothetical protein
MSDQTTIPKARTIVDGDGYWWAIFHGEDIPEDVLREEAEAVTGDGALVVETWHLRFVPRVKWCSRHDGWGCDNEGEWHNHWFEVKPGTDTAHTVARTVRDEQFR